MQNMKYEMKQKIMEAKQSKVSTKRGPMALYEVAKLMRNSFGFA